MEQERQYILFDDFFGEYHIHTDASGGLLNYKLCPTIQLRDKRLSKRKTKYVNRKNKIHFWIHKLSIERRKLFFYRKPLKSHKINLLVMSPMIDKIEILMGDFKNTLKNEKLI